MVTTIAPKPINTLSADTASTEIAIGNFAGSVGTLAKSNAVGGTHGDWALEVTSGGAYVFVQGNILYPCIPGDTFSVLTMVRAGATSRPVFIYCRYSDADQQFSADTVTSVNDLVGSWTAANIIGTVPPNSYFCQLLWYIPAATVAGEKHYLDSVSLSKGTSTEFAMPGRPTALTR